MPRTAVILMASRFERVEGPLTLLEAAAELRGDWTIWMAGGVQRTNEEPLAQELRAFVRARGLEDRVRFLGERRDVPRLLRGADILCQPNLAPEPFGIMFVEALYAGLPVVTSDIGGAREIVTPKCGVLLPPGDVAALRAALQMLVDDPDRRQALGAAGPARATLLCDPATQIQRLERALAPHAERALA